MTLGDVVILGAMILPLSLGLTIGFFLGRAVGK